MKKIILAFLIVFVGNLGCKKLDKGDQPCACSPIYEPTLVLVLKNANGTDVLNPANAGYFSANQIQLYYLEGGVQKKINSYVRGPFTYGNEKFNFFQLHSSEIIKLQLTSAKDFYLKLGDNEPKKVNLEITTNKKLIVNKLLVDGTAATAENGALENFVQYVFYVTLP